MHYVFTNAAAQVQSINALKVALAARNSSIYKLISRARARAVNVTTLPTTPPNGYVALFNKAPMGIWQTYPAYMAIYIPQVIEGGAWFLVSSDVLGNVAQDYRAAQYRLIVEANGWVETITDSSAEGIGPAGPPGAAGASSEVSKLAVAASYNQGFAPGEWISHAPVRSAIDSGERTATFVGTTLLVASIRVGFPVLHIIPPTGEPYYDVMRLSFAPQDYSPGSSTLRIPALGQQRLSESQLANSYQNAGVNFGSYISNRSIDTPVRVGSRVRFVGICVTNRFITTDAQNTNVMPYRYCTHITMRENLIFANTVSTSARGTIIYPEGYLQFARPAANRTNESAAVSRNYFYIQSFGSNPNGTVGHPDFFYLPIRTGGIRFVDITDLSTRATRYVTFQESDTYYTMPS